MGTAIKHPVRRLNPVWHRMLYSCTHMATVGVKGLNNCTVSCKNNKHRLIYTPSLATANKWSDTCM